ncbi:hypothetical protein ACGFNU_03410 [Spirillospora sp. NPDC048911]|uniref:hypothetical protein n=1 Tax=Spirillospora sp. NPDC048911 TaxID=3364527 RepID=UPI003711EDA8
MLTAIAEQVARLRGDKGRSYEATLRVTQTVEGSSPLSEPGTSDVVARISKSAGLPVGVPDGLDIAIRTNSVDLLFATTGAFSGIRHILRPRRSFMSGAYTTLLPHAFDGEQAQLLGLIPTQRRRLPARLDSLDDAVTGQPLRFTVATATLTGPWRPCGTLEIHTPLPEDESPSDAFDLVPDDLPSTRVTGPLLTLRCRAYEASRRVSAFEASSRRVPAVPRPRAV